jgi:hypothetical protein
MKPIMILEEGHPGSREAPQDLKLAELSPDLVPPAIVHLSAHRQVALATGGPSWNRKKAALAPQESSLDLEEGRSGPGGRLSEPEGRLFWTRWKALRTRRKAVLDCEESRSGPGGMPFLPRRQFVLDRDDGRSRQGGRPFSIRNEDELSRAVFPVLSSVNRYSSMNNCITN